MNRWKFSITILSCLWVNPICSEDACTSLECIQDSATILKRLDNAVNPCDDFYDFACGNFIQENYTPDESAAVDTFTKLKESIDTKVFMMMRNDVSEANTNLKMSQELFKTCLERNQKDGENDLKTLREIVEDVGGWPLLQGSTWNNSNWSLGEIIMNIRRKFGYRTDNLFDITSFVINLENANNPSFRPSATFVSLRSAYFDYISNLLSLLGDVPEIEDELNHLLDFEYKLNLINHNLQQLSRSAAIKQQSKTSRNIFYFQWLNSFFPSQMKNVQNVQNDDGESTSVSEKLETLLNQTSTRTLANFVVLRVVDFVAANSKAKLGAIYERFQRKLDGRLERQQEWIKCVDVLTENLPFAIGDAFIKNHLESEAKSTFGEIYQNIKDELSTAITKAAWIDENTQDKLLEKLQSLIPLIAFPDKGFNEQAIKEFYEGIKIDKSQYLRTLFQLRIIDADDKFRQTYMSSLTDESDLWRKYLAPTNIATQYSASDNTIRFSAGILQNLLFEGHKINYLRYGSTGFIIAIEISHIVTQIINDAESVSEKVQNEFTAKKQCLIEQYGEYREPKLSEMLNGKRTAIENFADNTGINLAYRAYKSWSEKFTGKRLNLIGLEFTWDQLFWLSAAQTWCGVYRREELIRKVATDDCATERFRVIGPLQNSPDFARDFNCSQLSPMNRKNKCIIW